jgi:hypothetical protein
MDYAYAGVMKTPGQHSIFLPQLPVTRRLPCVKELIERDILINDYDESLPTAYCL